MRMGGHLAGTDGGDEGVVRDIDDGAVRSSRGGGQLCQKKKANPSVSSGFCVEPRLPSKSSV